MADKINKNITSEWDEMVEVRLPKAPKTEQNFQFVGVNGRAFQVPKGKSVMVPKPVAEVIANSEKARQEAEDYESDLNEQ